MHLTTLLCNHQTLQVVSFTIDRLGYKSQLRFHGTNEEKIVTDFLNIFGIATIELRHIFAWVATAWVATEWVGKSWVAKFLGCNSWVVTSWAVQSWVKQVRSQYQCIAYA